MAPPGGDRQPASGPTKGGNTPSGASSPDPSPPKLAYTDGACLGNPGPGGWGVVLLDDSSASLDSARTFRGGAPDTTNNRMEMQAAVEALRLVEEGGTLEIRTDSQYLVHGMQKWLPGWIRKNWRTAEKKPVKNADLWMQLQQLAKARQVRWVWVRGHDGNPGNEMADRLAVAAAQEQQP